MESASQGGQHIGERQGGHVEDRGSEGKEGENSRECSAINRPSESTRQARPDPVPL